MEWSLLIYPRLVSSLQYVHTSALFMLYCGSPCLCYQTLSDVSFVHFLLSLFPPAGTCLCSECADAVDHARLFVHGFLFLLSCFDFLRGLCFLLLLFPCTQCSLIGETWFTSCLRASRWVSSSYIASDVVGTCGRVPTGNLSWTLGLAGAVH